MKDFLNGIDGTKIVCGDFNIARDTQAMAIIDENMTDLIKENSITSTRNRLFAYPETVADYIIVDRDMTVKDFRVMTDEVSDHRPLLIDLA